MNLWGSKEARAVRPISANIALVAGEEGHAGFRDGSFTSALFHTPLGLAASDDGDRIFVADSGNNRVRIIHLDQNNEVTTLAGQDAAGRLDGPIGKAQFNDPHGVLYLPDDRLVVNDFGNRLLRLIDIKNGTVTTFAGGVPHLAGAVSQTESVSATVGPAAQVSMNDVTDMAYMPSAQSIFFTQPASGSLKTLNLKTGLISTIFNNNTQIPHPAALWCEENKLYVADKNTRQIFKMVWKDGAGSNPESIATPLANVLSLSVNGNILYALLGTAGIPAQRFFLNDQYNSAFNSQVVSFRSPWGDTIPQDALFPPQDQSLSSPIGFTADVSDSRKLYVSKPEYNVVICFRDLFGYSSTGPDDRNSNGLNETEYPAKKPKNTFRILFVGDSRSMMIWDYPFPTDFHSQIKSDRYPQILSMPKQAERELNLEAALNGTPLNYEVLNLSHTATLPLFLWPTYEVPAAVKRNDIDLVIIFMPRTYYDFAPYKWYFDTPITPQEIPQNIFDAEYLLKPPLERIPNGISRDFYDYCKAHDLVKIEGNSLKFDQSLFRDPELHPLLVQLYGKPMDLLNKELSTMKTSAGQKVRLLVCSIYTGRLWSNPEDPQIWADAAVKYNFPILDLNAEMNALQLSFFPLMADHLDPDGHAFYGQLIARDLIRDNLIPTK